MRTRDMDTMAASIRKRHGAAWNRRQSILRSAAGFTIVELVVVMVILGVIISIALPQLAANLEQGYKAKCLSNRHHMEQDERDYYLQNNASSLAINSRYQCPSGGTYVWLVSDPQASEYPRAGCSLHYGQIQAGLTSLGSTFTEITTAMTDLINKYYQQNKSYPASLSALGLNSAEWAQPVNGLYYTYSPRSGTIVVEPTSGFILTVNNLKGRLLTVYPDSNKDLEYVLADGTWYYFTDKNKNNAVDISTLKVVQN